MRPSPERPCSAAGQSGARSSASPTSASAPSYLPSSGPFARQGGQSTILRAMLLPLIPLADWFRTILRVLIILLVTIVALYAIVVLYVRNLLRGNLEGRFKRVGGMR